MNVLKCHYFKNGLRERHRGASLFMVPEGQIKVKIKFRQCVTLLSVMHMQLPVEPMGVICM